MASAKLPTIPDALRHANPIATVAYTHPNKGMGVAFRDLKPYFVGVLKKWLLAAMLGKHKHQE